VLALVQVFEVEWTEEQHRLAEYEAACAYWQGFLDGYARCDADLAAALARALGGPGCRDYGDGVARHLREADRRQARAAWDAAAADPRPGDYPAPPAPDAGADRGTPYPL
jgi:hypothetical protein